MATTNFRFSVGDSLLCYHGPMLYEAKCLKRRKTGDGKAQYFIHYKGWKSKWEEWVDDDRVLVVNAENMNKMASLKEIHLSSKKSGFKKSITVIKGEPICNVISLKGKKREHSKMSIESIQTSNTSSPSEPIGKRKPGRPPKHLSTSKSESGDTDKVYQELLPDKTCEVTDKIVAVKDTVDTVKKIEAIKKSEKNNKTTQVAKKTEVKKEINKKPAKNKKTAESVTKIEAIEKTANASETTEENKEIAKATIYTEAYKIPEVNKKTETNKKIDKANKKIEANIKTADEFKKTEANKDTAETAKIIETNNKIAKVAKITETNKKIAKAAKNTEANKKIAEKNKKITETTKKTSEAAKKTESIKETTEKILKTDAIKKTTEKDEINKVIEANKGTKAEKETEATVTVESTEAVKTNNLSNKDNSTKVTETYLTEADSPKINDADESMKKTNFKANTNELTDDIDDSDEDNDDTDNSIDFNAEAFELTDVTEISSSSDDDDDDDDDYRNNDDNDDDEDNSATELIKLDKINSPIRKSTVINKNKIVFKIPDTLKQYISLDYVLVNQYRGVLKFPCTFTIQELICEYINSKQKFNERERAFSFCSFITMYFNLFIHSKLLYEPEFENNLQIKATNELKVKLKIKEISDEDFENSKYSVRFWHHVYGPIYILRLIELLPSLLLRYSYEKEDRDNIVLNTHKFLKFIECNTEKYCPIDYEDMNPVENADL